MREEIGEMGPATPWEGEVDAGQATVCGVEDCAETEDLRAFPWLGPEIGLMRWVCAGCRAKRWARLQDAAPTPPEILVPFAGGTVAIA